MKSFNRHTLAIFPLLSILAMSPGVMLETHTHRGIASVLEENSDVSEKKEEFKKFKEYSAKVDPKIIIRNENLTIEDLKKQESDLKAKLSDIKIDEKKAELKKDTVSEDRKAREALVVDLLFIEDGLAGLDENKKIESSDKEALEKSIVEHKTKIEELLIDLEKSEEILAQSEEPKQEEPKLADEEPKKEEPKKEDEPKVAEEEPKKEEPKVAVEEPKKEEPKKEICEAEEKNALLTKQIEQLLNDQKQIMQTMLGMAQMMVSMHQQSQGQSQQGIYQNPYVNPYQYHQPYTAGNWVYYPQGFQPQQPNIFAQPQMMQPQMQGGFYPDQAHQQGQWTLAPQYNFQADPRYTVQPITPGSFGMDNFSYNLNNPSPSNPMPVMGNPVANTGLQMPMGQMNQMPQMNPMGQMNMF